MPLTQTPAPAPLYAELGHAGATMLFERPERDTMSWLAVVFHTMREGETYEYRAGHPQPVTWAREALIASARAAA